jgi:IS1 family transposase
MNVLSIEQQVAVISALTEGMSIRSVERLTGIHRDTIMRLGLRVGDACGKLHDRTMHSLRVNRIEIDEIWSFVGKRQRRGKGGVPREPADRGDQYLFTALASSAKAIISYRIGKRDVGTTQSFLTDLRARVLGTPEISSDAFSAYEVRVPQIMGTRTPYGQVIKHYSMPTVKEAARRYAPGDVVAVEYKAIQGDPSHISTSYVERSNLTIRMANRRFGRLTNAHSKRLPNHAASVSLFVMHYNFCRVHETTKVTPAMALGLTDHPWSIGELVHAAHGQDDRPEAGARYGQFTVIDGGVE